MADNKKPIIIKRVKKLPQPHHGGAWKIAYADFVTAMMAFFLLLWLLSAVTEQQLQGISDYFAPLSVSQSPSGSGGFGGGKNLGDLQPVDGRSSAGELTPPTDILGPGGRDKPNDNPVDEKNTSRNTDERGFDMGAGPESQQGKGPEQKQEREPTPQEIREKQLQAALASEEQKNFEAAKAVLENAIAANPEMERYRGNLLVDNTAEGLRIQIVDRDGLPMFPPGQFQVYAHTRAMLEQIASVVNQMPEKQKIAISGYTDSTPFPDRRYTNWELSSERALITRRILTDAGVPETRIERVVGRSSQEPLDPSDPAAAQNRRISIVLLRENKIPDDLPSSTPLPASPS